MPNPLPVLQGYWRLLEPRIDTFQAGDQAHTTEWVDVHPRWIGVLVDERYIYRRRVSPPPTCPVAERLPVPEEPWEWATYLKSGTPAAQCLTLDQDCYVRYNDGSIEIPTGVAPAFAVAAVLDANNIPRAQANEVVQCRDCKHFDDRIPTAAGHKAICWKPGCLGEPKPDGSSYCSYGEPRKARGE